ncbi:hypothetical protein [Actinomadura decatromicini]|uniref:Uncharacterized protein n=1 Tax=Actinomadura decatromicini TaxID=2604572 RepID=A0A5D3FSU1_9ACTN|nr:hypothetical protein [Actinomadura decatromicini]TYK50810.1 hypothetical protein FXF68_10070 [Actinomadura decatromicini]
MRLEAVPAPGVRTPGRDSCGAHLAEIVHETALWARERRRRPATVVVYATTDVRRPNEPEPGPFDRVALGTIPI